MPVTVQPRLVMVPQVNGDAAPGVDDVMVTTYGEVGSRGAPPLLAGIDQENSALVGDRRATVGLAGALGAVAANSRTSANPLVVSDRTVTTFTSYVVAPDRLVKTYESSAKLVSVAAGVPG